MKKNVLTVVAVVLMTIVTSAYMKNEPPGFRGNKWGMALPGEWGQRVRTDPSYGGTDFYNAPGEDLTLDCATLASVEYGFWQGKLSDVAVSFDGYVNYRCVLDSLKEKFGHGLRLNQFTEQYFWFGEVTRIIIKYDVVSKHGSLRLMSGVIANEQKAWQKAQAKKGAKKF